MADLPDPSTLTDEELDALLDTGVLPEKPVEETPPEATPPAPAAEPQPKPEEEPEEEEEPDQPEEEVIPEEEEKPVSRREELRIQKLLAKYGSPEQQPAKKPVAKPADALNYEERLDADPELIKELEADREAYAVSRSNDATKIAEAVEWRTLLQIDGPAVQATYPQLNPKDEENFHPAVNNAINTFYLTMSGYDAESRTAEKPGIRYTDFVESVMELAEEIAATKVVKARKEITKQAKQTGIRPDGSRAKKLDLSKPAWEMSDEELDAKLKAEGLA